MATVKLTMDEDGYSSIERALSKGDTVETDVYSGIYCQSKGMKIDKKVDKETYEVTYVINAA